MCTAPFEVCEPCLERTGVELALVGLDGPVE